MLDEDGRRLPPEFTVLRFEPQPWTGTDVLVWVKMMAWDLSGNHSYELMRLDMMARVGPARTAELLPRYPDAGLSILSPDAVRTIPLPPPERGGGLPKGGITELISPNLSAGSASLIAALLRAAQQGRYFLALIDGRDSFDPVPLGNACLRHIL